VKWENYKEDASRVVFMAVLIPAQAVTVANLVTVW